MNHSHLNPSADVMRLFPSTRRRLAALPEVRRELQSDLRQFIKVLGPALGELYYGKDLDWKAILEMYRKEKDRRESLPTVPSMSTFPTPLNSPFARKKVATEDKKDN